MPFPTSLSLLVVSWLCLLALRCQALPAVSEQVHQWTLTPIHEAPDNVSTHALGINGKPGFEAVLGESYATKSPALAALDERTEVCRMRC